MNRHDEFTDKEVAHCITALCLYCRESVNRMKLRKFGGLKLFVSFLNNPLRANLHDRIINSLLQFSYDEMSLHALQMEGLVPCLTKFIQKYTSDNRVKHDCAVEICEEDDEALADPEDDVKGSNEAKNDAGEETNPSASHEDEDSESSEIEDLPMDAETTEDQANQGSRFRVNSPSYQAVQDEFDLILRIKNEQVQQSKASSMWAANSPSPSSPSNSPDRMPFEWGSPGYSPVYSSTSSMGSPANSSRFGSPERSPSRSWSSSPVPSPSSFMLDMSSPEESDGEEEVGYSPIEHFSDEEQEAEPVPSTSAGAASIAASPPRKRLKTNTPTKLLIPTSRTLATSPTPKSAPATLDLSQYRPMPLPAVLFGTDLKEKKKENSQLGWILQILSRLSHSERPHEDMTSLRLTQVLIKYLCEARDPLPRAGRILTRLTQ